MPNVNYHVYVKCPFFLSEKKKSISCEDTFRTFEKITKKKAWMRIYCDKDWETCPYADSLNDAYERLWKGDSKALEQNNNEALRKELGNMAKKLGRAEKKAVRQQKKIDELRAVNQSFSRNNQHFYQKWKDADKELQDYRKNESARYFQIAKLYEDRIAYLIDRFCGGRLAEADVKSWAEGKEYALTFDGKAKEPIWIVKTREETEEDGKDVSESVQGAAEDERTEAEE